MKIKFIIVGIFYIIFLSCNNSNTTSSNDRDILSPDEWLQKYNEAWAVCNKQIPEIIASSDNFLNPDEDINNYIEQVNERIQKVEELVKQEFPELYEYTSIPEYQSKLAEQGQNVYNSIIYENQVELDQLDLELNQQVKKNQQELELEKQRMEQFLKNYHPPQYQP